MQIPILSGIYTDSNSNFRTFYPTNLIPVPKNTGISEGFLRPAEGIVLHGVGPGKGRGGINWADECYRVMGNKLVKVLADGSNTILADIPGNDRIKMQYSFDYLSINADEKLYLWNGTVLQQITDTDLGKVVDHLWVDGYFMTTDGENIIVTELNNPFSVNPLKYGSSEIDPDPIKALLKVRNEPHALNRYTIETFRNIGGEFFPFQRIEGAQIQKGTLNRNTCCVFQDVIAFLGSGLNEAFAIYLAANGQTTKISTLEIDQVIQEFDEQQLNSVTLETRIETNHAYLYVHFPNQTWVFDSQSSAELGQNVWFKLTTSLNDNSVYKARNFIRCYDKWLCEDPTSFNLGYLTYDLSTHYSQKIEFSFNTLIIYNMGKGAIVKSLELISLTGRTANNVNPFVSTSYSNDGITFSQPKDISAGKIGQRDIRLQWRGQGRMKKMRIQKFRFTSDALLTVAALEAEFEPLYA